MEQPNIATTFKDEEKGVRWTVMAYRTLTMQEAIVQIRGYLSSKKVKRPKRGEHVTILTIIGHSD